MALQLVPLLMFLIFVFMLLNLLKTLFRKSKLAKRLPPGPFKLPILGNLLQVTGALPHRSLYNLSEIHGPLMHLQLGSPVNISEKVSNIANSITCRSTIGKRCKYQHELIEATENIAYWGAGFFMADLFPSMLVFPVLSGMKPALQKVRRELDHIFDYIINEHKEKLATRKEQGTKLEAEEEDLVDILLRINDTLQLEFPVTSNDIQGIVLDMFTAGTDTSSAVLEWAMSELMKKPSAMKKAQDELRNALKGKKSPADLDMDETFGATTKRKNSLFLNANPYISTLED
ncbi:hypothetical protein POM88_027402 [Heracleum sosnowskyi]|uniref:Cytochrome P450 n=1 Tax=Heracleum sosnowskyi TaxID=360622 RepID=A0AAD8MQY1_9APIA|nr:hypothetical protein POM88_027402 [Heracleum sosnowskyi]